MMMTMTTMTTTATETMMTITTKSIQVPAGINNDADNVHCKNVGSHGRRS